jgi:hypothetical protein
MDNTGTVLGAFVTVILALSGIGTLMLKQSTKDRDADRKERKELSLAIAAMAKSSTKVAEATERSANEAKQRNGHLGEQNIHIAELVAQGNETNTKILTRLEDSATTLVRDTHDAAVAVKTVQVDLRESKKG